MAANGVQSSEHFCDPDKESCSAIGEWSFGLAFGLGARTNPLIDGNDIPLVILPSISYYGENFFIDNLDLGYTLWDSQDWMFNALITPSYDRVFFERWDIGNLLVDFSGASPVAMPDPGFDQGLSQNEETTNLNADELKKREFSLLGGIEVSKMISGGQLQLGLFGDVSGVHSGQEARLAYSIPIKNSGWSTTLGLTWKDAKMTDYYYGVDEDEVVDNRGAYQAGSSLNPFVKISWQQQQENDYWRFGLEYQALDDSLSHSPLINKNYVITAFIGKQFNF